MASRGLELITMNSTFKAWIVTFLAVALFSLISVSWFDKPTALLVHDIFGSRQVSAGLADSRILSVPLVTASIFVIFGILAMMGRQFSIFEKTILLCDISILAAYAIKNQLKFVFGRTWPDSWRPHIISLVHDNAYGFHFFQSGGSFESFPSGHATIVAAVMSVLWIVFPRLRFLYAICIGAADVGLVLLNLHFISDVVVGTFVGFSTGLFTVALCLPNIQPTGFDVAQNGTQRVLNGLAQRPS
jgi:membrane-associated phospholipid phosphatase